MGMQKYTGDWPNWIALTGEIIAQNAKECAWPYGTSKSKYTYEKGDIKKNPNPKQYGNYKKQLDFKWNRVKDCISKIGGISEEIVSFISL